MVTARRPGEYGVLSLDGTGLVTLTDDDGTVYSFNAQGKVTSVTSPADSLKPATPISTYRPGTGQIDRISDPLSVNTSTSPVSYDREVRFVYGGDSATSVGLGLGDTECPVQLPVDAGFTAPPGCCVASSTPAMSSAPGHHAVVLRRVRRSWSRSTILARRSAVSATTPTGASLGCATPHQRLARREHRPDRRQVPGDHDHLREMGKAHT